MNRTQITMNKSYFFNRKPIIALLIITISALLFRIFFASFEIPVISDSFGYFLYAKDISLNSQLPSNYTIGNNGWPIFLSGFFSIFEINTILGHMQIQKTLTIILSSLTVLPVYFLCKKFFNSKLSLIGAIIFAFEPRIILNSSLGITEPLYILLGTMVLVFFLSDNKKMIYGAFIISAFVSMIRTEGIFLFAAISIIFIVRFRKEKIVIPKYFLALTIFILLLLPMANYRTETMGHDGLSQRIINGINGHILGSTEFPEEHLEEIGDTTQKLFFVKGAVNFTKYLGWDMIPIFIFFVPIGIFFLFKELDFKKGAIITCMISISIPAFYSYSIPLEDTRYLFFLYPLFCVISLFTINKFQNKFKNKNIVLILIVLGIIFSSVFFLQFKSIDYEHQRDAFEISKILIKSNITTNEYSPESQYIEVANILSDSSLESYFAKERIKGVSIRDTIPQKVKLISPNNYSSLIEFIQDNKINHLTHIVTDEKDNRLFFLKDVYENESNYPYLIKEFDSLDEGFTYHLKLFKIDFDKLNESIIN